MIEAEENRSTAPADKPSQLTTDVFEDALSIDATGQEHFATDHLLTGLKERAVSSGVVTMAAQAAQFVLTLASTMVLARLLTPQDFGLVAMVTTVIGFFRIFNDAGLSTATVQREGITHAQVSNLFWTNVTLGVTISLFLAIFSPVIAWFYQEPRLVRITLALCLTFLFTTAAVQHMALLKRQMRFKAIAFIQVSSMAAGILTGIGMALLKFGSWSLVGMQLATPMLALLLTWSASRWRPQLPTRRSGTRSLLSFGANLTASSFLWSLARGSDSLLIGRFFGSAPLGLYSRAAALLNRPLEQAMGPLEAVFVPTFSRLQSQPERYRRMAFQVYDSMAIGSFPLAGMLLALAHPLTLVVLGPKWESAAMIFAGFTLVALYVPIAGVAGWLLSSQGRGRDYMVLSSIVSSITVLFFLVGLRFGPIGVAMSYSLSCLLVQLPVAYYVVGRRGPVTTKDLWSRFFTHLPLWGVVCGATWVTRTLVSNLSPVEQLLISTPVGLLAGVAFICAYAPSRHAATNLLVALQELLRARRSRSSAK
jgi:O-antigen/teichoic acid export membrane protein